MAYFGKNINVDLLFQITKDLEKPVKRLVFLFLEDLS